MPMPVLKKLGLAVRRFREAQGLSQEKLAERAGVHRTYISGIERGQRNVGFENLVSIAQGLEIPLSDLVRGIDDPE
jgi:transcriptional regulator with XRE-family HTH domain